MARAAMHVRARVGQPYWLCRLYLRVSVWFLYGELAGSRDRKCIFWSRKFISANRFHFSELLKWSFHFSIQLKWNFHFSPKLK
jgi:hypothetical protein